MGVEEKDRLDWVFATRGQQELMLVTASGQSIRFSEEDVRSMGLAAGGVGGIKLQKKDLVIYAAPVEPEGALVTFTTQGFGKRTLLSDYSSQGRNGSGIVTHKPTSRTGEVAAALMLPPTAKEEEELVAVTVKQAVKTLTVAEIPLMGRNVQGKGIITDLGSDQIATLLRVQEEVDPPALENKVSTPSAPATGATNGSAAQPVTSSATVTSARATGTAQPQRAVPPASKATTTPLTASQKVKVGTKVVVNAPSTRTVATKGEAATDVTGVVAKEMPTPRASEQTARQPNKKETAAAKPLPPPNTKAATTPSTQTLPPRPVATNGNAPKAATQPEPSASTAPPAPQHSSQAVDSTKPAQVRTTKALSTPAVASKEGLNQVPARQVGSSKVVANQTPATKVVTTKEAKTAVPPTQPTARTAPQGKPPESKATTTAPSKPTEKVTTASTPVTGKIKVEVIGKTQAEKTPPKVTPSKTAAPAKPTGKATSDQEGARAGQRTFESLTPQSAALAPEPVAKPQSAAARRANTGAGSQTQPPTAKSTVASALAGRQPKPTPQSANPAPQTSPDATQQTAAKPPVAPSRAARPVDQPQNLELFPLDSEEVATGTSKDKTPKTRKLQVAVSVPKTKRE